jgi:hypothetical protein
VAADRLPKAERATRRGLAPMIVAVLRSEALHSLLDNEVDLEATRTEIEQPIINRLQK